MISEKDNSNIMVKYIMMYMHIKGQSGDGGMDAHVYMYYYNTWIVNSASVTAEVWQLT